MSSGLKKILSVAFAAVFVYLALRFSYIAADSTYIQDLVSRFGYIGLFLVAVVSGFNVVVPIPVVALLPGLVAAGLMFWPAIFIITLGMTTGDTIGFLVGRAGRQVIDENNKWLIKIKELKDKNKRWPLILLALYASFAPAPNELIVVPMAFLGYRFKYMMPILFIGNLIFNTLIAYGLIAIAG